MLAQVTSIVAVANERLTAAQAARTPKATLEPVSAAIASARTALDDAGKALASEDYLEARRRLEGVAVALNAALQTLPTTPAPRAGRRSR